MSMSVNLDMRLSEFKNKLNSELKNKKIVIWGAGVCAMKFLEKLDGNDSFIKYYVDVSEEKWNTMVDGCEVKSPDYLWSDLSIDVVIIATMYLKEVIDELEKKKWDGQVFSAFHMVYREEQLDYHPLEEHLEDVIGMLCDEKSKANVQFILEHRKDMNLDYSEIYEPNQYFVQGIVKKDPYAVFVDGGSYHGETIDEFMVFQNGVFDKVYAFEMDAQNYAVMCEKKYDKRVETLRYGLWDEKKDITYTSEDTSSCISGKGDLIAKCIPLDDVIGNQKISFIKMDIEGAEMKALYGAEKCIKRCKPQLAICIYHKADDIYEITNLIHTWLPKHKLYIRHHSCTFTETVLYAVP